MQIGKFSFGQTRWSMLPTTELKQVSCNENKIDLFYSFLSRPEWICSSIVGITMFYSSFEVL